jgi:hypothetical protein
MKKRWIVVTVMAGACVTLAVFLSHRAARLRAVGNYIEEKYAPLLALIEAHADDPLPEPGALSSSREGFQQFMEDQKGRREILDRIDAKMSAPEFHEASWSSDGHHGLESLHRREDWTGHSVNRWQWAVETSGDRTVMQGGTFGGSSLYVYEVWLPKGPNPGKRQYQIAFDRRIIDAALKNGE